jgi:tRNA threonylcarbamoyl adenosine modification protein YeaZ
MDTATSQAVVAVGGLDGRAEATATWAAGRRHDEELLSRISGLLRTMELTPAEIGAVVVGTGPGAFTGLRVGLSTAKTLAHQLRVPIVGVSSAEALLHAAASVPADDGRAGPELVLLLPAGSTDLLLVRAGRPAELVPGGQAPQLAAGEATVAVDLDGRADLEASERGRRALDGLAAALVRIGAGRLVRGEADDVEQLVPEYVTLPRGVVTSTGEIEWSRDRR